MRAPTTHLNLPFFDDAHREIGNCLADWLPKQSIDESDDRRACREWVALLGSNQWLRYCVAKADGGVFDVLDSRSLVIARENLAFHSPLADFAFAMQGLGTGAITLAGDASQRAKYLSDVATGKKIAAFALSEPNAGSDVAAMTTSAVETASGYVLNGEKTWISNGGLANFYCVFAKTNTDAGSRGISAFIVDAQTRGLDDSKHTHVMSPHPLSSLTFTNCEVPKTALLGEINGGFKLAMQTLDIFRASVAAAALGMARRALAEAIAWSTQRKMFNRTLADFQLTQAKLGEMATLIDAAALLTYRAAWLRDTQNVRTTCEAAMAKMTATENAQRVIDMALQMHGGRGVEVGAVIEHLYRDIRSLRIYEGATEVQQLIVGKSVLNEQSMRVGS
jgi:acyl-CoA dehydrogenase